VKIANSPPTDIEFMKSVAAQLVVELRNGHEIDINSGILTVHVVDTEVIGTTADGLDVINYNIIYTPTASSEA
jgi:hypothetical protein